MKKIIVSIVIALMVVGVHHLNFLSLNGHGDPTFIVVEVEKDVFYVLTDSIFTADGFILKYTYTTKSKDIHRQYSLPMYQAFNARNALINLMGEKTKDEVIELMANVHYFFPVMVEYSGHMSRKVGPW